MGSDWKDLLSNMRDSFEDTGSTEEDSTNESVDREESQKSPLTVVIDKKGRSGKTATIIEGFQLPQERVEELAKTLKSSLGVGGSTRSGEILIQGDHKSKVIKILTDKGFKVR